MPSSLASSEDISLCPKSSFSPLHGSSCNAQDKTRALAQLRRRMESVWQAGATRSSRTWLRALPRRSTVLLRRTLSIAQSCTFRAYLHVLEISINLRAPISFRKKMCLKHDTMKKPNLEIIEILAHMNLPPLTSIIPQQVPAYPKYYYAKLCSHVPSHPRCSSNYQHSPHTTI